MFSIARRYRDSVRAHLVEEGADASPADPDGFDLGRTAGVGPARDPAGVARCLCAIAHVLDGMSRAEMARLCGPGPNSRVARGHFDQRRSKTAIEEHIAKILTFAIDFCDSEIGGTPSDQGLSQNSSRPCENALS